MRKDRLSSPESVAERGEATTAAVTSAGASRILIFILGLGAGGAERLASTAASHWAAEGRDVTIMTYAGEDARPFYDLHPDVRWRPLSLIADSQTPLHALGNNFRRWKAVRQAIRELRPDVILSYMDRETVLASVATRGLGIPVVGYVVSDPSTTRIGAAWRVLRRLTYGWLDGLVVQTERAKAFFPANVQRRCVVLPNPVPAPPAPSQPKIRLPQPCLITIGRLVPVKNQALMLQAFARARQGREAWSLVIVGEGDLRGRLEQQARDLGIQAHVHFPGLLKDPYSALRQAEGFVLSSTREGFPMALCEAMSCGLPVVATDCPNGPREIIRHDVDGLLVPSQDEAALAGAMGLVMDDPNLRRRLGARAAEVQRRFGADEVMARLTALLDEVAGTRGS